MWLAVLLAGCDQPAKPPRDGDTAVADTAAARDAEVCDGLDNDGDGLADAADPDCEGLVEGYEDTDGDGYGVTRVMGCPGTLAYVGGDCFADDPGRNPGAAEVCDGLDQDCDGLIDDGVATTWYADGDDDGWGSDVVVAVSCASPGGTPSSRTGDCDDAWARINPDAAEVCNGDDDDCDGLTDGQDPDVEAATWHTDADRDGFGDAASADVSCNQRSGWVADGTDCDDGDRGVNPAAPETCNGRDDDCDGLTDDDDPVPADAEPWFDDADGDGEGGPTAYVMRCVQPAGTVEHGHDCDDADPSVVACADSPDDGSVCAIEWGTDLGGVPAWTGVCNPDLGLWEHEGSCYWTGTSAASVADARATCAGAGGYLATMQSTREDDAILEHATQVLLGGCQEDDGWAWFTGEAWHDQGWYDGEPGADTCVINANLPGPRYRWFDTPCTRVDAWVCEFGDVEVAAIAEAVTPDCATAAVSPAAEALDVARDGAVTLVFDADVDAATIADGMRVRGEVSGLLEGTVSVDGRTATWTPSGQARAGERVTAVLSDAARCADGGAVTPRVWSWFATVDAGATGWSATSTYAAGGPGVAVGQVDGDEALEIAVAAGGSVLVVDDAELGAPVAVATLPGGTYLDEVVVFDADGDGNGDLAAVDRTEMAVYVWLGDGAGGFTAADTEVFDDGPTDLAAADVDADGALDLVVALGVGTDAYVWLRNDGAGDFGLRAEDLAGGGSAYHLAVLDAEGDGDLDVAGALYDSSTLDLRWNDGVDALSQGPTQYDWNLQPLDLWAGDLDGDGEVDLAATGDSDDVLVFIGNGAGDFDLEDDEGRGAYRLAGGDLDADGDLDLVVGTATAVAVYENDGGGDVASSSSLALAGEDVAVADLDGDGVLDLVVADGTLTVLLGVR